MFSTKHCFEKTIKFLQDFRANRSRCVRVRELRASKICHAKVCKQIWRPPRKVKKEVKVGDS